MQNAFRTIGVITEIVDDDRQLSGDACNRQERNKGERKDAPDGRGEQDASPSPAVPSGIVAGQ